MLNFCHFVLSILCGVKNINFSISVFIIYIIERGVESVYILGGVNELRYKCREELRGEDV